jgi:hypothetical protein
MLPAIRNWTRDEMMKRVSFYHACGVVKKAATKSARVLSTIDRVPKRRATRELVFSSPVTLTPPPHS